MGYGYTNVYNRFKEIYIKLKIDALPDSQKKEYDNKRF